MAKIEITKTMYANFGNCVKMTNGIIELYITTDVGPRIIHFSRVGMENILYNDHDKTPLGEHFGIYGDDICRLYGGHRIWISPEIMPRCYHPDNEQVTLSEVTNGMSFAAAVEKHNQIQKVMTITLSEETESVIIEHSIRNLSSWDIELAPWCITMLAAGGVEVMPQPDTKTGLLHNRNISLWDYSDMSDERVYWGKDFIVLRQQTGKEQPFKLGYNNDAGWAAYFNKGQVFFKFFEPKEDGFYPDNNCSYESYTNDVMLEAETLGEIVVIPPGDEVVHIEEWGIFEESTLPSNNEEEIKALIDSHLEL